MIDMRAIIVGTGAGGAVAARELALNDYEVTILEAGSEFKPFTRNLSWAEPLRRLGLLGNERTITRLFPALDTIRSSKNLTLVRGLTTGGSTSISCGNMVRANNGLKEIGLDLTSEYEELEDDINIQTYPRDKWQPITSEMYNAAEKLGLNPKHTPKCVNPALCVRCGYCELGCSTNARWTSNQQLKDALNHGAELHTNNLVTKLNIENNKVKGVTTRNNGRNTTINADITVLAAGGVGTPMILENSGLNTVNNLWVDIVLTMGGVYKNANQIKEPPMTWYTKSEDYILSPYPDILSHWFYKPWKNVNIHDRVGLMVKLADEENGQVNRDNVEKYVSDFDESRLQDAVNEAKTIMEEAGVKGPFITGMPNGGHLGGTVPLQKEDVESMKPQGLPDNLWVADLSLIPSSQGLPTILLTAAVALRVARQIISENKT